MLGFHPSINVGLIDGSETSLLMDYNEIYIANNSGIWLAWDANHTADSNHRSTGRGLRQPG
jgi:hypothetical protein